MADPHEQFSGTQEEQRFIDSIREIAVHAQNNQLNPEGNEYPQGGISVVGGRSKISVLLGETNDMLPISMRAKLNGSEISNPLVVIEDKGHTDEDSGLSGKRTFFAVDESGVIERTIQIGTHTSNLNATYTPYDDRKSPTGGISHRHMRKLASLGTNFSETHPTLIVKRKLTIGEVDMFQGYLGNPSDSSPVEALSEITKHDEQDLEVQRIKVAETASRRAKDVKEQHEAAQRRRDSAMRAMENPRRYG